MKWECAICSSRYTAKKSLNRHLKTHGVVVPTRRNVPCLESNCTATFQFVKHLIVHLRELHGREDFVENLFIFDSAKELEDWRREYEEKNRCSFRQSTKNHYVCNRSHKGKKRDSNRPYKRQQKAQGSCRINCLCTAYMKIREENGKFMLKIQPVHYGHLNELKHVRLTAEEKEKVAEKLRMGIPINRVWETIADEVVEGHPKRIDLLTKQDIANIAVSHKIQLQEGVRHPDDATSVHQFVADCRLKENNPVLLYKQQGTIDEANGLKEEDFCLIYQNQLQGNFLKKFGPDIVAIDGTHGLNGYDYELVTLMVVDEFRHGFPVAFMFTNRKDTWIYILFFSILKDRCGSINSNTFMSDMAEAFGNAWSQVMGPANHMLWCAWHVDRAWSAKLLKIADRSKREEVRRALKELHHCTDIETFHCKLAQFLTVEENSSEFSFINYFKNTYTKNFQKWAYCFRQFCGINTNMYLETMHKEIKYFILQRKSVKRLDKGLNAVLKYLKLKSFNHRTNIGKGVLNKYSKGNFTRHNLFLQMSNYEIFQSSEQDSYIITNSETSKSYTVTKNLKNLTCHCQNVCRICKVCVHTFSCTCPDFMATTYICKHIHLLSQRRKDLIEPQQYLETVPDFNYTDPSPRQTETKLDKERETARKTLQELLMRVDHFSNDQLTNLNQTLQNFIDSTECKTSQFVENTESSSNRKRKIDPQKRFVSTKKQRKEIICN